MKQLWAALTLIIGTGVANCDNNAPSRIDNVDSARLEGAPVANDTQGGNETDTNRTANDTTARNRSDTATRNK
ncbi:MAG: hypothetical protein ACTHLE_08015 [Agriterribacter sp.]